MKNNFPASAAPDRLEDLPNVGHNLARDLRAAGIASPADLRAKRPRVVFDDLKSVMGSRHDPCVFYTLLAVQHYFETKESVPWWRFSTSGKRALEAAGRGPRKG